MLKIFPPAVRPRHMFQPSRKDDFTFPFTIHVTGPIPFPIIISSSHWFFNNFAFGY
jgi:hypothetical protein